MLWVQNYLDNSKQICLSNNKQSNPSPRDMMWSVPQGSILMCVFLYVNYLDYFLQIRKLDYMQMTQSSIYSTDIGEATPREATAHNNTKSDMYVAGSVMCVMFSNCDNQNPESNNINIFYQLFFIGSQGTFKIEPFIS